MKTFLIIAGLISLSSFVNAAQVVKSGVIMLNGAKHDVKISYTQSGYSTKDNVQIGTIANASIKSIASGTEISAEPKDGSMTISIYLDERFKQAQASFEGTVNIIQPLNIQEITCGSDSDVNSMIIIYSNIEPYNTLANCLKLF